MTSAQVVLLFIALAVDGATHLPRNLANGEIPAGGEIQQSKAVPMVESDESRIETLDRSSASSKISPEFQNHRSVAFERKQERSLDALREKDNEQQQPTDNEQIQRHPFWKMVLKNIHAVQSRRWTPVSGPTSEPVLIEATGQQQGNPDATESDSEDKSSVLWQAFMKLTDTMSSAIKDQAVIIIVASVFSVVAFVSVLVFDFNDFWLLYGDSITGARRRAGTMANCFYPRETEYTSGVEQNPRGNRARSLQRY